MAKKALSYLKQMKLFIATDAMAMTYYPYHDMSFKIYSDYQMRACIVQEHNGDTGQLLITYSRQLKNYTV